MAQKISLVSSLVLEDGAVLGLNCRSVDGVTVLHQGLNVVNYRRQL
jgi:hypothetical protein